MSKKTLVHIKSWKELRDKIKWFDEENKIIEVMKYWQKVPIVHYVMDWDKPENWLTPWEIIHDDYYDDVAISYMMAETLILDGMDPSRIELRYVQDKTDKSRFMILIIDGKYVLNYSYGEVLTVNQIQNNIITYSRYSKIDDKYTDITGE